VHANLANTHWYLGLYLMAVVLADAPRTPGWRFHDWTALVLAGATGPMILFVLPAFEGRRIGSRLLDLATQWLWANGSDRIWLTTAQGTRAAGFYERRGWIANGRGEHGDVRYEQGRPRRHWPEVQRGTRLPET